MSNPKISVIIPVYNVEKYIGRCIESILHQTFNNFEIIIVNDKTPDKSIQIAKEYAKTDNRIRFVENMENSGLMYARAKGVESAIGDYIIHVDSDDTLAYNAMELLYNAAEREDYDILSGNIVYKKLDGNDEIWKSSLPYGSDTIGVFKALLSNKYRHNLCGHIFSRELLTKYSYHIYKNFTKWEDYCLFYQLVLKAKKIGHIDEPVYEYYQTIGSSTQAIISERSIETTIIAHKEAYSILKEYPELKRPTYRNFQYCFFNLYLKCPKRKNMIDDLLKKHLLKDIMKYSSIFEYNQTISAVKIALSKFKVGILLLNKLR